jgi:hypothetical protein
MCNKIVYYDLKNNILYIEKSQISAYNHEKNEMGNCSNCDAILISLSYHLIGESIIVVTKCTFCGAFYANIYNSDWNWIDEVPVSLLPIRIPIANPIIDDKHKFEFLDSLLALGFTFSFFRLKNSSGG